jgi:hypothetical protein
VLNTQELLRTVPASTSVDSGLLAAVVDALQDCEEAVTACAAAMLGASSTGLLAAVGSDTDCADVAATTRRVLIRSGGPDGSLMSAQLEACLVACERSNDLCSPHAGHHDHCRLCSTATRQCAELCRRLIAALHQETLQQESATVR